MTVMISPFIFMKINVWISQIQTFTKKKKSIISPHFLLEHLVADMMAFVKHNDHSYT